MLVWIAVTMSRRAEAYPCQPADFSTSSIVWDGWIR
jgi:hypothetical protein